jgi:hypothetical protein
MILTKLCQLVLYIVFGVASFIAVNKYPGGLDARYAFVSIISILAIIALNGFVNQRIAAQHVRSTNSLKH